MYDKEYQTRLTNKYAKDNPCNSCGVLLPKTLSKCSHCTEKDRLFQIRLKKCNPKYGAYEQTQRKILMKKMGKRKYINRGSDRKNE